MITVDIAAPRPTAKGKRRNGSNYPLTPVTPYQRSASAAARSSVRCMPLFGVRQPPKIAMPRGVVSGQ